MHKQQRRGGMALALLGSGVTLTALLSAGCGSSGSDPTARISSINLSPNSGTSGVLVNGAANGGDLSFGSNSPFNYIGQGLLTFGFSTGATLPTTGTAPVSAKLQLNNRSFYTSILIGRADTPSLADVRYLQTVVTGDKGAAANYTGGVSYSDPPSGQANVRIINGAPDAGYTAPNPGAVDVLINGQPAFANVAYPAFPKPVNAGDTSGPAVTPATPYQAFPGGTLSVQVNVAKSTTVLVPPTNVSVSAGKSYTIIVTEPSVTPTYGLYTSGDQP